MQRTTGTQRCIWRLITTMRTPFAHWWRLALTSTAPPTTVMRPWLSREPEATRRRHRLSCKRVPPSD